MMRSLFSAISGLKGHQSMMDIVGNNIANVNTTGFKTSRMTFSDIISQTIRGASAPVAALGGLNPMQVGLGMQAGSIDSIITQGNLQSTNKPTDVAIQGDGFFVLSDGANISYTRDGNFSLDAAGNLVHAASGLFVQKVGGGNITGINGPFNIDANGNINLVGGGSAGQIGLANFPNPAGLSRKGANLFGYTPNAAPAVPAIAAPNAAGLGSINSGFLEMSNVDLAQQFSNMIIAERGFQANSRVITATDEILQDLVNIKR